jgi:hypothetical protein
MQLHGSETPSRGGSALGRLRAVLTGGAAVAILVAALGPVDAGWQSRAAYAKREQPKKEPPPKPLQLPLIVVSIADQHVTVFDKGEPVARAPVSTGMQGHPTPTGVFTVLEKEVFHRSNIYSGAPMPYMQRITWSGVALHAGVLPGYPASHGCIRLPPEFAVKLFGLTQRGARVLVTRSEVKPAPFADARLFTLPRLAEATNSVRVASPAADQKRVRTAESGTPGVVSDAIDSAAPALAGTAAKPAPATVESAGHEAPPWPPGPPTRPALDSAARDSVREAAPAAANESGNTAASDVTPAPAADAPAANADATDAEKSARDAATRAAAEEAAKYAPPAVADTANTNETPPPAAAAQDTAQTVSDAAERKVGESATGTVLVTPVPVVPAQPVETRGTFEAAGAPPKADAPVAPAASAAPATADAPAAVPAAPVIAAAAPPNPSWGDYYGPERPLRPGPITVFVSKKEGKLFIRKGFQPIFTSPVKVVEPELALGTHVFTAVDAKADGVGFDWLAVTIPGDTARKPEVQIVRDRYGRRFEKVVAPAAAPGPAATAAEALARVEIPPFALARIASLMSTGATLIISDQGVSGETGLETDFIVLTR